MCTATIAQEILDALQARIDNGSVFTAFDVTTDVRDGNPTERINHRDTRRIVHEEFSKGEFPSHYNQGNIELDVRNNPMVIVYYPDGKSESDHPKALRMTSQTAMPAPSSVSQASASQASAPTAKQGGHVKDGDGFICTETSKGVINIPKDIVDKAMIIGGSYDLSIGGDIVYKKPDGQGRLRISSSKLGNGGKFKLTLDTANNTIVVETA